MQYGIVETGSGTPASVISTADLKAHLRVTHSDEDTMIEAMREAAIRYVENFCNVRIGSRSVVFHYNGYPSRLELPIGPVTSVTGITIATGDGTADTIPTTDYFVTLGRDPMMIEFSNPRSGFEDTFRKLNVSASVGYTEADTPGPMVHAIKLLVAHMYELRQPEITGTITTKLKLGIEALLNPYRIISFR
jgi:uncharacterized phiE125 gp8 family phage protein